MVLKKLISHYCNNYIKKEKHFVCEHISTPLKIENKLKSI